MLVGHKSPSSTSAGAPGASLPMSSSCASLGTRNRPLSTNYAVINSNASASTTAAAVPAGPSIDTEPRASMTTVVDRGASRVRESIAVFAEILSTKAASKQRIREDAVWMGLFEFALKLACVFSMASVCVHTPDTLRVLPSLELTIFVVDWTVTAIFTLEAFLKVSREALRSRWFQFDVTLLVFHYLSVLLHTYELTARRWPALGLTYKPWYGVVRSLRPLIMIRLIRSVLRFKLPRNRIKQIIKRSSQQIQNVTIFFLFFMTLYAIVGVQLFGRMEHHCVVPGADPYNISINDLAVPDTKCSAIGAGGYECPGDLQCLRIQLTDKQKGLYGMFNDFGRSLFTVYLAASEEGWVYVLYDCLDSFPSYICFFYFVTLVFFLAWLVKNVFIAVITETFAEFRVQFSEMWQAHDAAADEKVHQMRLGRRASNDDEWTLVTVDADASGENAPRLLHRLVRAAGFHIAVMILVMANALVNASFVHRHDWTDAPRKKLYYVMEVIFTIIFNVECLLKVIGLTWPAYIRRGQHKFELILCVGSTFNVVPSLYPTNIFTYFQVLRIVRLIKASPMLEDFVYKIFGPGKKLGGLIFFTLVLLVITSAISLQLFCYLHELEKFRTFPRALMSMFQIITQEGWTDEVVEILRAVSDPVVPLVAVYFVGYHLFVTLILLSLFVAVILDNLEMDEELKKVKQLKAREETTCMRTTLPWRLRIFEKFPTRPQMVRLTRVNSDFPMPKVRDSFTRQFFDSEYAYVGGLGTCDSNVANKKLLRAQPNVHFARAKSRCGFAPLKVRQIGQISSRYTVNCLIEESNKHRITLSDSTQFIAKTDKSHRHTNGGAGEFGGSAHQRHQAVSDDGGSGGGYNNSMKARAIYDHFKKNGDVRRAGGATAGSGGHKSAAKFFSDAGDAAPKKDPHDGFDIKALQQKRAQAEFTRNRIEKEMRENHPFFDRPLFLVGRNSRLRRFCRHVVETKFAPPRDGAAASSAARRSLAGVLRYKQLHSLLGLMTYLDWAMVLATACSCASMLFESPWPPSTGDYLIFNNVYLRVNEYAFVLAMTFELVVKILANGLFFTPKAVVGDVGGVMTLFIYITSVWYMVWMPRHVETNSFAQLLMIFRAMRPLRIYTLVPHIRRVVVELCKGFKDILLVTILLVLLMFVFASFGVQIAGGQLAGCNDPTIKTRENCTSVFEQKIFVTRMEVNGKNDDELHPKILVPRVWTNPRNFNFDHIGNAMLALFETLSYKGWNVIRDILWHRKGTWAVVFIHVYVFIGCMIGVTLFIGVVVANYTENSGTALLTVDQRRWNDLKARLRMAQPLHVPPKPSESAKIRNRLYVFSTSRSFKQFYAILVVVNSISLVVPWSVEKESSDHARLKLFTLLSAVCNILFGVEIIFKMVAFTFRGFWESKRNRIDLLITVLGTGWIVAHFIVAPAADTTRLFRVAGRSGASAAARRMAAAAVDHSLRRFTYTIGYVVVIMRFFTIAGRKSTLKMLMLTVSMGMVRSCFIITAMFLLVLFYAYAGVILFGMVKYGQAVSKHVNFRTGKEALVVLFRSVTGEDWNDIMHDCMRSPPLCYWREGINYYETDCGNYFGAIVYFCSFYLIIAYIVLNLLVAIIMENFSLFYSSEEDALLSYSDIRNYQQVWNLIDVEQKHMIPTRRVKFLLRLLKGRLEVDPNKDRLLFKHMCHEMERFNNGCDVSFHDILSMLSYRSVDIRKSLQLEELLQREELEYTIEEEVAKQTIRTWLESCLRRIKQEQKLQNERTQFLQSRLPSSTTKGSSLVTATKMVSAQTTLAGDPGDTSIDFMAAAGIGTADEEDGDTRSVELPPSLTATTARRADKARNFALKKVKSLRRSSIPELVVEAKRLWGARIKSLPSHSNATDRPESTGETDSTCGSVRRAGGHSSMGAIFQRHGSLLTGKRYPHGFVGPTPPPTMAGGRATSLFAAGVSPLGIAATASAVVDKRNLLLHDSFLTDVEECGEDTPPTTIATPDRSSEAALRRDGSTSQRNRDDSITDHPLERAHSRRRSLETSSSQPLCGTVLDAPQMADQIRGTSAMLTQQPLLNKELSFGRPPLSMSAAVKMAQRGGVRQTNGIKISASFKSGAILGSTVAAMNTVDDARTWWNSACAKN